MPLLNPHRKDNQRHFARDIESFWLVQDKPLDAVHVFFILWLEAACLVKIISCSLFELLNICRLCDWTNIVHAVPLHKMQEIPFIFYICLYFFLVYNWQSVLILECGYGFGCQVLLYAHDFLHNRERALPGNLHRCRAKKTPVFKFSSFFRRWNIFHLLSSKYQLVWICPCVYGNNVMSCWVLCVLWCGWLTQINLTAYFWTWGLVLSAGYPYRSPTSQCHRMTTHQMWQYTCPCGIV